MGNFAIASSSSTNTMTSLMLYENDSGMALCSEREQVSQENEGVEGFASVAYDDTSRSPEMIRLGKQPAVESLAPYSTSGPIVTLLENGQEVELPRHYDEGEIGCLTALPATEQEVRHTIKGMAQGIQDSRAQAKKIADIKDELNQLIQEAQAIRVTQDARLDIEPDNSFSQRLQHHLVCLSQRGKDAKHLAQLSNSLGLASKVIWCAEEMLRHPEKNLLELNEYIQEVRKEKASVLSMIPRQVPPLLGATLIAFVVAPAVSLVGLALGSLGYIPVALSLSYLLGILATVVGGFATLTIQWFNCRNSLISEAYQAEQALIQQYDSLIAIYERVKAKMEGTYSYRAANASEIAAAGSAAAFSQSALAANQSTLAARNSEAVVTKIENLEAALKESRERSASNEKVLKEEIAQLREQLRIEREEAKAREERIAEKTSMATVQHLIDAGLISASPPKATDLA